MNQLLSTKKGNLEKSICKNLRRKLQKSQSAIFRNQGLQVAFSWRRNDNLLSPGLDVSSSLRKHIFRKWCPAAAFVMYEEYWDESLHEKTFKKLYCVGGNSLLGRIVMYQHTALPSQPPRRDQWTQWHTPRPCPKVHTQTSTWTIMPWHVPWTCTCSFYQRAYFGNIESCLVVFYLKDLCELFNCFCYITQSFQGKAFGPSRLAWMHLILLPFTMSSSFSPIFTSCLKRPCTVSYLFWTTGIWRSHKRDSMELGAISHTQASKRFWQPWKGNPSCRKAFYTRLKPVERLFAFLANKQLHLIRKILRISGHINHTHHVQLGSQEVLVANGLPVPYHGYHGGGKTIPWKSSLKDHASNAAKSIDTNFCGLNISDFLFRQTWDANDTKHHAIFWKSLGDPEFWPLKQAAWIKFLRLALEQVQRTPETFVFHVEATGRTLKLLGKEE